VLAVIAAAGFVVALAAALSPGESAEATHQPIPLLAVDTNITGNSANTVGTVQTCGQFASVGSTIQVDVVVQGVPAAVETQPGVWEHGLAGVSFDLLYDPAVVRVTGFNGAMMMAGAFTGFSNTVPDSDGKFRVESAVFGGYPSGNGAVVRFTLEAVGTGTTPLTLVDTVGDLMPGDEPGPNLIDPAGNVYTLTSAQGGQVTVSPIACGAPTPTPFAADVKKRFNTTWYRYPSGLTTQYWFQCGNPPESVDCRPRWIGPNSQAVADWNNRPTGVRMALVPEEDGSLEPDIFIASFDQFIDYPGLLGVANTYDSNWNPCSQDCIIRYADVLISDLNHAGPYGTPNERRATVAHELGHVFDLRHESTNAGESIEYECGLDDTGETPHSVMSYDCIDPPSVCDPSCGDDEFWVQDWDVCGVNQAYPSSYGNAGCLSAPSPASYFHAVTPYRLVDSRSGQGMPGSVPAKLGPGQELTITPLGTGGIPAGATAVVLNVTVTQPTTSSFLTVYPSDAPRPLTSNLNFVAGDTRPNAVTVRLSPDGKARIYNFAGSAHVIVDVAGWYDTTVGSLYNSVNPARVVDTRNGTGLAGKFGQGQTRTFTFPSGIVPAAATAVVLNATVTEPTAGGFLTVYPADAPALPVVSNLNFVPGQTVPNLVTVKLSAADAVKIFNSAGQTHVILDVAGWYGPSGQFFRAVTPARALDTRVGTGGQTGALGQASGFSLKVPTVGGLPHSAAAISAIVVNATVTAPTSSGFVTLHPANQPLPLASNLNFVAGQTVPNLAIVKTSPDGHVRTYNALGQTHVIADIAGWFGPP
jgi:hypothetical protein